MKEAITLFEGCIAPLRYPGVIKAFYHIASVLGLPARKISGFSCCPAPGIFRPLNEDTFFTIAARNLAVAEGNGVSIVVPCNGCYETLHDANELLTQNPESRDKINRGLREVGREYHGKVKVSHVIDLLHDNLNLLQNNLKKKLKLRVAVHYGCHYIHLHKDKVDGKILEKILETLGATPVEYGEKTLCCGAGRGIRSLTPKLSLEITRSKLESIQGSNADCICVICSFCLYQLDRVQRELSKREGKDYSIPVFHILELLSIALNPEMAENLGFETHSVDVKPALKKALT